MPSNKVDDCYEFKLDNPTPVEIDRTAIKFCLGSHHVHVYRSDTPDRGMDPGGHGLWR